MNLQTLDLETLLRRAYAEQNDLTTSDMERELLRRLETLCDSTVGLDDLLDEQGSDEIERKVRRFDELTEAWSATEIAELLDFLASQEITEVPQIKALFDRNDKFRSLANDLADTLPQLTTLLNETLE